MTKLNQETDVPNELFGPEDEEYYSKLIEKDDQIEKMKTEYSDCSEEELFNRILKDDIKEDTINKR